jgi:hypothetical protein
MIEVIARARSLTLETDPFPHVLIDDALDVSRYEALAAEFPSVDGVNYRGKRVRSNHLYLQSAADVATNPLITPAWKQFFQYPVSIQFWRDVLPLVKSHLLAINPRLEDLAGRPLEEFRAASRERDNAFDEEIALDCQFGVNSPVTRKSSVRSPHVDHPTKLFNALLYCRAPEDDTPGGDLVLYRCIGPPVYTDGSSVMPTRVVAAKRIAYRANRFVLFLNSPWSVHAVAPRPPTPHVRRYINFLCEFRQPLFERERLSSIARFSETARVAVTRAISNPKTDEAVRV